MAQQHLEQTVFKLNVNESIENHLLQYILCQNFPGYADLRVQTASYLAEIYSVREPAEKAIAILRNELENAHDSFWKCRFLFQLAVAFTSLNCGTMSNAYAGSASQVEEHQCCSSIPAVRLSVLCGDEHSVYTVPLSSVRGLGAFMKSLNTM